MRSLPFIFAATAAALVACGSSDSSSSSTSSPNASVDASQGGDAAQATDAGDASTKAPDASLDASGIVADRPYTLHVPPSYDKTKPTPLVVMFHGYSATGAVEESYFRLTQSSDANGFLYAYGDGTLDSTGQRYWNATDACCDLDHAGVDDVQYFDAIVADVSTKYNVDPKRIYVIGHSNGGFMAHRLACERSKAVAAIVSLAGAVYLDASKCNPTDKVSILELHGDADQTILYAGGSTKEGTYPSAHATVATWAQKIGCTGALTATGTTFDMDSTLPGNETKVETYTSCPAGSDIELLTIQGGSHIPSLNHAVFTPTVWSFFATHPKP